MLLLKFVLILLLPFIFVSVFLLTNLVLFYLALNLNRLCRFFFLSKTYSNFFSLSGFTHIKKLVVNFVHFLIGMSNRFKKPHFALVILGVEVVSTE